MITNNLTNDHSLYRGELAKSYPRKGIIKDLIVRDLDVNVDDRGLLSEICRLDWKEVASIIDPDIYKVDLLKQVYIVQNNEEAIRAFHAHENLVDLFCLVKGHAKFILIDNRIDSITFAQMQVVNVSEKKLQLICVPRNVFHGWKGSKDCILVSIASELYMGNLKKGILDELRIPWNHFGSNLWETEFK